MYRRILDTRKKLKVYVKDTGHLEYVQDTGHLVYVQDREHLRYVQDTGHQVCRILNIRFAGYFICTVNIRTT